MALDEEALREARDARERLLALQRELEQARAAYHGEIGRLHAGGASLREIADALGLSHQRVHQIIEALGHEPPRESGSDPAPSGAVGRRTPGGGGQGLLGGARPSWRAALLVLLTIGGVISSMALWPTRAFADPARYSPAQGAAAEGVPPQPTNTGRAVATAHARSLHTRGLSLALRAGWSGFSYRGGANGRLPVLRMASFSLPRPRADDDVGIRAERLMRPGDVLVNLLDEGRPDRRLGLTPARLPLRITRRSLGSFAGCRLGCAVENVRMSGRAFAVWVVFGRAHPSAAQLALANSALATLRVRPPR